MPTTAVLKLPAAAIGMPRESGPPGPAQESLLGSEEAAPELNAFEAFRAGRKLGMNPADHLGDYVRMLYALRFGLSHCGARGAFIRRIYYPSRDARVGEGDAGEI